MRSLADNFCLTNAKTEFVFGPTTSIDGDASLYALFRAINIQYGDCTIDNIAEKSKIATEAVPNQDPKTLEKFFKDKNTPMRLVSISEVKTPERPEGEPNKRKKPIVPLSIEVPDDWETTNTEKFPTDMYLSQYARCAVFINKKTKQVIAFVEKRINHYWVQSFEVCLSKLLPWFYTKALTEEQKEFFRKLGSDYEEVTDEMRISQIAEFCEKAAAKFDFESYRMISIIKKAASAFRENLIFGSKQTMEKTERDIKNYTESLARLYTTYEKALAEFEMAQNSKEANTEELQKFFSGHKQISILDCKEADLLLGFEEVLEFFDPEEAKRMLNNKSSYLYGYDENVLRIFAGVFRDLKGAFKVKSVFKMVSMKLMSPIGAGYSEEKYYNILSSNSMPNPHIYFHTCSGANGTYYQKYAQSGEWQLAIEQALSATKNLALGDSTVVRSMINWIKDNMNTKCIYMHEDLSTIEEGVGGAVLVSPKEFNEILKKEEEKNG